jgi:hypothetical protein
LDGITRTAYLSFPYSAALLGHLKYAVLVDVNNPNTNYLCEFSCLTQ